MMTTMYKTSIIPWKKVLKINSQNKFKLKHLKLLILFLIISSFTPTLLIGQELEKEVKYADTEGKYISKKEFNKCLKAGLLSKTVENEKTIIHYLTFNSYKGTLTETENKQIRLMLEKIVNKEIDSNRTIVIHLYNKNDDKLIHDINYSRYWNAVDRSRERTLRIFDVFLIGNKDSGIIPNPKNNLYLDSYNFLNNTFFNNSDLDYNHLYIRPDGNYKIYIGFFDNLYILDGA